LFPSVIFFIAYLFPLFQVLVFISLILAVRCSFSRICNFLSIYKKCLKIPKGVMRITPWQVCCYPCCFYIDFLIRGLGNDYLLCNPTYTSTTRTKEEIQDNLNSALCSLGISTKDKKKTGYFVTTLHTLISYMSSQAMIFSWNTNKLHAISFQINNIYSISGQHRLQSYREWYLLFQWWCKSDADSKKTLWRSVTTHKLGMVVVVLLLDL